MHTKILKTFAYSLTQDATSTSVSIAYENVDLNTRKAQVLSLILWNDYIIKGFECSCNIASSNFIYKFHLFLFHIDESQPTGSPTQADWPLIAVTYVGSAGEEAMSETLKQILCFCTALARTHLR